MALIEISETQLAFGYLHSYLNVFRPRRFMIPSIRQEGGRVPYPYPGADIILNSNHLIQFKRPYYFTTNGIKEYRKYSKPNDIDPPYYRFHIKNDNPTNQLSKLVEATQIGLTAEYISPLFNNETNFFNLMRNHRKHIGAYAHIDISQFSGMLGTIGNNNDHTILYNNKSVRNNFCYCFSEPKKLKTERITKSSDRRAQEKEFKALEIVDLLSFIFFNEKIFSAQSGNALYQCKVLQSRLLIQYNIIWYFNFRVK